MTTSADQTPAWGAEALWESLVPRLPDLSVEVIRELPSTNATLLERARLAMQEEAAHGGLVRRSMESRAFTRRSDALAPCLLVAQHQTAGRGRMGRTWLSSAGDSLTFSLSLSLARRDLSGLSLAVGVALAQALDPAQAGQDKQVMLKWPNDLVCPSAEGFQKLGGVLIETVTSGPQRVVVIGVGINLAVPKASDLLEPPAYPMTGLRERWPGITAQQTLAQVALPLVQAVLDFDTHGLDPALGAYAERDILFGQALHTQLPGVGVPLMEGTGAGIHASGAYQLDTPQGLKLIHSGEVSVRLQNNKR